VADRDESLKRLLNPSSVALIGVGRPAPGKSRVGGLTVLSNLQRGGFAGAITVVHPSGELIDGIQSVTSIQDCPFVPDLAVLALPAGATPDAVLDFAALGTRAFVILTAGFSEAGTAGGDRLEAQLHQIATDHDLAICGPNCLGLINVATRTFTANFSPLDVGFPKPGGLAIISQSGAIAGSLMAKATSNRIGLSYVISTGNETGTTMADYVAYLADEPGVRSFAIYLEGTSNPRRLLESFEYARSQGKPVVVYKVGESEAGARAALSHTAQLAGRPELYRSGFTQAGVVQASTLSELVESQLYFLSDVDIEKAPSRACVISISGGLGAVAADELSRHGIDVPELSAETRRLIDQLSLPLGATTNPVDTAAATQRREGVLADLISIVAADPGIDSVVLPLASRFAAVAVATSKEIIAARAAIDVPVLVAWYAGAENLEAINVLRDDGSVSCFDDLAGCASAIRAASVVAGGKARPTRAALGEAISLGDAHGTLDEPSSKGLLAQFGLPLCAEIIADSAAAAQDAARSIGTAVALKIVSPDIIHKAAAGGVKLGLLGDEAVAAGYQEIVESVGRSAPDADLRGVLVSEMVDPQLELIVGAYQDAEFGAVLAFGAGGSQVEELNDVQLRLLPLHHEELVSLVAQVLAANTAPVVFDQVLGIVEKIADLVSRAEGRVLELDINPLIVTADDRVLALDAVLALSYAQS
jgi:acyl-CoA synthetase (NDP forming)